MIVFLSPDALRAARALARLDQRSVESRAHVSRKVLRACETDGSPTLEPIARLRQFYDSLGIEFLGCLNFTTNRVVGAGVRWKYQASPDGASTGSQWHREHMGFAFTAARALSGLEQRQVASRAKLAPKQVRNLEQGYGGFTRRSFDTLRDYYEETGMEFLGVGVDVGGERSYFGVGVRWSPRSLEAEPASGPEPASQPVPS
ncbi:hypothetical protein HJB80_00900 [Rhizobium lentis]|uniref:hypothetical protein n=1 Tax=Rhizobium lentis TaxID=1138194 RepID=UPI001C82BC6B|nr:hypothetical protein [Rhizobium lentis]MBX5131254.1 hypothetical protein [Rhizobium lentis]